MGPPAGKERSLPQEAQVLLHESIVFIFGDHQLFAVCQRDLSPGIFLHMAQVHQIALVDAGELSAQFLLQFPYLPVVFHCAFL